MNKLFRIYFSPESDPSAGEPKPKDNKALNALPVNEEDKKKSNKVKNSK